MVGNAPGRGGNVAKRAGCLGNAGRGSGILQRLGDSARGRRLRTPSHPGLPTGAAVIGNLAAKGKPPSPAPLCRNLAKLFGLLL